MISSSKQNYSEDTRCNQQFDEWTDRDGFGCDFYLDENWCSEGTYGSNWGNRGFFLDYMKTGLNEKNRLTASNCPQCGCRGN